VTADPTPPLACPAHDGGDMTLPAHPGARRKPPGPRGLPVVGVLPLLARDVYGYFPSLARKYGDVVEVPVPGMRLVLLAHPRHVNHVFIKHMDRYVKGPMNIELINGDALPMVLREGDDWKRVRRVLNPGFTEKSLAEVSAELFDEITTYLDGWSVHADTDEIVDFDELFAVITAAALLRAMFSRPTPPEQVDELQAHMNDFARAAAIRIILHHMLPSFVPRPLAAKGNRAHQWIRDYIDDFIAQRRRNPIENTDLLNVLLDARFDDGSGLPHDELRSEVFQLLFAGFDTTATALGWTFAFLGANPDALAKAYEEVDALGGRPVTHADIADLKWLRACFDEGQRLQGAPFHMRMAVVDDEIDGFLIPKGTYVTTAMSILHRDPRWWREPERFDPSRFLTDTIDRNAFMPFGVGPRKCLGMRMAYIEAVAIMAGILQRYEFDLAPGFTPRHTMRVSTAVKGGVPIKLRTRSQGNGDADPTKTCLST